MENIYLPETIRVGYDKRSDTYTGKLAYVIYIDEKGKVRKEGSWNSWRDKKIEPNDFKNEPTEGFVLNKRVGGYSTGWNHRQTYTRIYDPRGFEFEITIENLLYILENTSCIKGKGLEGKFVYGWSGKDLLLIPCDSPDYEKLEAFSKQIQNYKQTKVKAKELIFGAVYRNKQNEDMVYIERLDEYSGYSWRSNEIVGTKRYWFYNLKTKRFTTYASPSVLIGLTDATPVENYSELVDELLSSTRVSPIDETRDEFVQMTIEEITDSFTKHGTRYGIEIYGTYEGEDVKFDFERIQSKVVVNEDDFYNEDTDEYDEEGYEQAMILNADKSDIYQVDYIHSKNVNYEGYYNNRIYTGWSSRGNSIKGTVEELHAKYNFKRLKQYLKNGNEKR